MWSVNVGCLHHATARHFTFGSQGTQGLACEDLNAS